MRVVDVAGRELCVLELGADWSARELKDAIQEQTHIGRHEQWLCLGVLELPDNEILSHVLRTDSADVLLIRPRPEWAAWHQKLEGEGASLADAPDWVKADRKLVLIAAVQDPAAVVHAAQDMWSDRDFVLDAVEESPRSLAFFGERLLPDLELLFAALQLARACDLAAARTVAASLSLRVPVLAPVLRGDDVLEEQREAALAAAGDSESLGILGAGASATAAAASFAGFSIGAVLEGAAVGAVVAEGAAVVAAEGAGAAGASAAAASGGSLALASLVGAVALPLLGGLAINRLVPGLPSASYTISVAKAKGTCRVKAASVVWATEEGWGNVKLYYCPSAQAAEETAASWTCARILLQCDDFLRGRGLLQEIAWAGPAWPRSTIRKAVQGLNSFTMCTKELQPLPLPPRPPRSLSEFL